MNVETELDPDLQAELWPPCDMNWEFGGRCEKPAELIVRARCLRGCPPVTRLTCWECCKRMQGLAGYTNCAHGITPIEMLSIERLGGPRV